MPPRPQRVRHDDIGRPRPRRASPEARRPEPPTTRTRAAHHSREPHGPQQVHKHGLHRVVPRRPKRRAVTRPAQARVEAVHVKRRPTPARPRRRKQRLQLRDDAAEAHAQRQLVVTSAHRRPHRHREDAQPRTRLLPARREEPSALPIIQLLLEQRTPQAREYTLRNAVLRPPVCRVGEERRKTRERDASSSRLNVQSAQRHLKARHVRQWRG